jgi:pimeloyl-ACP methyl ester carboxylesterase
MLFAVTALILGLTNAAGGPDTRPAPGTYEALDYGLGEERDVVVDGLRLRVHVGGPEGAQPVVLLHPFGLNMKIWRDVVPVLEKSYRVIAYDAPGHGKSDRPRYRLTLAFLARTCVRLLEELHVERPILVGNSMGGGTSLTVALDHEGVAKAIVLVDSVGLDFHPWYGPVWRMLSPSDVRTSPDWAWHAAMDAATSKWSPLVQALDDDLIAVRHDPRAQETSFAFWSVVAHMVVHDRTKDLARLRLPALVVTGAEDEIVEPDHARRLVAGIAGAELHVFPDLGHLPEAEDAPQLLQVVLPFLARVAVSP